MCGLLPGSRGGSAASDPQEAAFSAGQLVGTEDALLQQLADSMLKEDCASELKV